MMVEEEMGRGRGDGREEEGRRGGREGKESLVINKYIYVE